MGRGKQLLLTLTLFAALLLSVYAYVRNAVNKLVLKPVDTRVKKPSFDDIVALTLYGEQDFSISNPNSFGITANEVSLTFTLDDGNKLGTVSKTSDLAIPAGGQATLTVPFTLNMASAGIAVFNALQSGAVVTVAGYVRFFTFFRLDINQILTIKVKV